MTVDYMSGRSELSDGDVVDLGDVSLWYHDDRGEGEPVFLLSGFTAGHFVFDFVRPHLSDYRLLTWEPRGVGPSRAADPASAEYGVTVWADDLHRLLLRLEIPRVHLWCGGFGSYIGLRFAASYPEQVGSLVTYTDIWSGDPAKGYERIWNVFEAIVDNFGTDGIGARFLAGMFAVSDPPWFTDWESRNIEEVCHAETIGKTVGYGLLEADVRSDLPRVEAPTLVLQGDRGWDGTEVSVTDDASVRTMLEQIPRAELAVLEGSHPGYVLVQRAADCARIVNDFLGPDPLDARGSDSPL